MSGQQTLQRLEFAPREWQVRATKLYQDLGVKDFLAVVTPGGGKTRWAMGIAAQLRRLGLIRRVIIVTPSGHIKRQWVAEGKRFGLAMSLSSNLSSNHIVANYQEVAYGEENCERFRRYVEQLPTLVIFDEIHHASDENSWGGYLKKAFACAAYRLLLTGTPFRTDSSPIPYVPYSEEGWCSPHYVFSYGDAVRAKPPICRKLVFHHVPGKVDYRRKQDGTWRTRSYLFSDKVSKPEAAMRLSASLDPRGEFVRALLEQADAKLSEYPGEAGLVIARTKAEARSYAKILLEITGQLPEVVYSGNESAEMSAAKAISAFREGEGRWLVSVKMVSEGVDIPRLRVLAYLTNITTEMFFRQAMGRIVRSAGRDEEAFAFMPAHPEFIDLSRKIDEERLHFLEHESENEDSGEGEGRRRKGGVYLLGSEGWESEVFRPFEDVNREDEQLCPVAQEVKARQLEAAFSSKRTTSIKVDLWLDDEEWAVVGSSPHYTPFKAGTVSGYAAAVRAIIREHLSLGPAPDPHAEQSAKLKGVLRPRK